MDKKGKPELIFVYNADSSLGAAAMDFVTRIFAPDNYSCNLCMVTYGPINMRTPWSIFLDTLPNKKTFLHRDEFYKQYPKEKHVTLPVILINTSGTLNVLVSTKEINNIHNVEKLKQLLIGKLQNLEK